MRTLKKYISINKNYIVSNLTVVIGFGAAGFLFHDIILAITAANNMEMTVFYLGTLCMYLGIMMNVSIFSLNSGYNSFTMSVSMGERRKTFFISQIILNSVLLAVEQLLIFGMYRLETWKLNRFYYPKYSLELDIGAVFDIRVILFIILACLSVGMFLTALTLKIGGKACIISYFIYMVAVLIISRMEGVLHNIQVGFIDSYFKAVCVFGVLFFCAGLIASALLIRKQQVVM